MNDVPWITKEGYFDPIKFPIDGVLDEVLQEDDESFRGALSVLLTMQLHGRQEAGIFMMGLLMSLPDDWEKRIWVLEAMKGFHTQGCANLLFSELRRVESNNTTRRYLNTVLKVLADMPLQLIEAGFEKLIEDKSFGYRMKKKFEGILAEARWAENDQATPGFDFLAM